MLRNRIMMTPDLNPAHPTRYPHPDDTRLAVVAAVAPEDNDDVLQIAWVRASTLGLRLVVCTVVDNLDQVRSAYGLLRQRTHALLPRYADLEFDVRVGDRAEEIMACVSSINTKLLVLGIASHREGILARFLSPSLPTALTRAASCPILVTRYSPPTGRILAAVDLGESAAPVLRAAAEEVARCGGQVHAVHCLAPIPALPIEAPVTVPDTVGTISAARAELEQVTRDAGLPPESLRVEIGSPGPVLLELARDLAADLIVVGTHGRSGMSRLVMGSVAEEVVRDAPCNVLVVRLGSAASTNSAST